MAGAIYVAVRGDYTQFQKDLARVRGIARENGLAISNALNNAITPTQAISGLTRLSSAIKRVRTQSTSSFRPAISGLDELAQKAGTSASQMEKLSQAMLRTAQQNQLAKAYADIQKQTGYGNLQMAKFKASIGDVSGALKSMGAAFGAAKLAIGGAAAGLLTFQKAAIESQMELEKLQTSYQTIFGEGGGAQLDFVKNELNSVGQQFRSGAEAAKTFFAAGMNSSLAPQVNDIFRAFTDAGAAMQLSGDEMSRVFLALGQMMSKGKVQAEELRGQLGEALPGAFQLAADAMGMTTAQLDKFMADGNLTAEDLLPKLAAALEDKYSESAKRAADTTQGKLNQMLNAWEEYKARLAASGPARHVIQFITEYLTARNDEAAAAEKESSQNARLASQGAKKHPILDENGVLVGYGYTQQQRAGLDQQDAAAKAKKDAEAAEKRRKKQEADKRSEELANIRKASQDVFAGTDAGRRAKLRGQIDALRRSDALLSTAVKNGELTQADADAYRKSAHIGESVAALQSQFAKIGESGGKGGGRKKSSAETFAENSQRYTVSLEKMRNEVEALRQASDPTLTTYDRMAAKINAEKEAAIKNADVKAQETIRRKEATAAQAEEMASLEKEQATLKAQSDLDQLNNQHLKERADWYREYAEESGDYAMSLQLQNELIDKQAKEWASLGIPMQDVQNRVALLKAQLDQSPRMALAQALRQYGEEAKDWTKSMSTAVTQVFGGMEDALANFVTTGKLSFTDFANSVISDLARIAIRASITGPLSSMLGGFFGAPTATASANGNVFTGIGDYSGQIVTRPTLFAYSSHLKAFAKGGVMGEAGPEAVMPLRRMSNGRLGVESSGSGVNVPINIEVVNETGQSTKAEARQQRNNDGGMDVTVYIRQVVAQDITRGNGGMVAQAIQGVYGVKRQQRGA
nr:MAG TPA: tail tape measure [Caudoviricetes sp.]